MWTCPKCGREFKRTNQGHYCGKAPETVEEYMESQSPEAQAYIAGLREILLRCIPDVTERIAWSMPVYKKGNRSISFSACKKHISLYIDEDVLEIVRPQLSEFVIKKNAVYLPYDRVLPEDVIETIVKQSFAAK
ncbi:MAG: DUF1801 domain-containing protein [Clostridia bacterium]|nr:DUF1801 domain-containing protein [Clostridia bacterium]